MPDAFDSKTVQDLLTDTLDGEYDDDRPWSAVGVLRKRNSIEVFESAAEFCNSTGALKRARGLDVLAQLGAGSPRSERPFFDDCVRIATRHLTDEEPLVIHSAAWALAHLADDTAISALLAIRTHADSGVRKAVAVGLAGRGRPEAIQTLIELMLDDDNEVRDWATFSLGIQSVEDSPQIRNALRNRLTDSCRDARDEAIWGLALRKDPTGLRMLLERLESKAWIQGDEDTAADVLGLRYSPNQSLPTLCGGLRQILAGLEDRS